MRKDSTPSPEPIREQYDETGAAYRYFVVTPVNNGVAYLDMYYPGWAERVDLKQFAMRYHSMSILSHIHDMDDYETPEGKSWSFSALAAHGFYCTDRGIYDYDTLTLRWKTVISNRRKGL